MLYCDTCKKKQEPYNPAANHCVYCGGVLRHYATQLTPKQEKNQSQNSKAWYLLPILLSFLGGIIMYAVLRKQNNKMAKRGLILGFAMTIPNLVIGGIVSSGGNVGQDVVSEQIVVFDGTHDELLRYEDEHKNKLVYFSGYVLKSDETHNGYNISIRDSYNLKLQNKYYLLLDYPNRLLPDDKISGYGKYYGVCTESRVGDPYACFVDFKIEDIDFQVCIDQTPFDLC